ncbi:MAG: hypothetical protein FWE91_06340 [Defluviitaleaceae bacterium]|nr:hypothetical protein [Defluviitaleaceae bacterium]MCL2836304.1 hypothetical protein [Defluviitaleaceae bacterium]
MGRRFRKIAHMRVLAGIVCISMGFGMLVVLFIPGWGFFAAAFLVIIGFWNLYMCY